MFLSQDLIFGSVDMAASFTNFLSNYVIDRYKVYV